MVNETKESMKKSTCDFGAKCNGAAGAVYGLGLIGAVIYYIQHAASFLDGLFGFLKALVWPAILAYKALELLQM